MPDRSKDCPSGRCLERNTCAPVADDGWDYCPARAVALDDHIRAGGAFFMAPLDGSTVIGPLPMTPGTAIVLPPEEADP